MQYKKFILSALLFTAFVAQSQNASDALRYSKLDPLGSARSVGVSGSMGAIGADFGSITHNPAGLAAYHLSEFVITPILYLNNSQSSLKGSSFLEENKYSGGIDNLGLVIVRNGYEGSSWSQVNFSVGFNKLADYNRSIYFEGATTGSITDHWREQALNLHPDDLDDFSSGLGYETGAIYDSDDNGVYESDFISNANVPVTKSQSISARGHQSELHFAVAGNYKDRVMIGAAIGIPLLLYREEKTYTESDPQNTNSVFDNLGYTEILRAEGSGINFKLGTIIKFHDLFRLGLSVQTPTFLEVDETYETAARYSYVDQGKLETFNASSPETGAFNYKLTTPLRINASLGSVIGKYGFLGASVEYVDYTQAGFIMERDFKDYQQEVNQDIDKQFQSAINVRAGAEIALDIIRLRGGVYLQGSPYANESEYTPTYSLGAGIRGGRFFTDFAIRHTRYDEGYLPYTTSSNDPQLVYNKYQLNRLVFTFGYKF
ncbi:MAG: hypothetical protein SH818_07200 [Saprospiraceae bacterium]|nr:hypothetical protein [Saprospiraceae bacterium]